MADKVKDTADTAKNITGVNPGNPDLPLTNSVKGRKNEDGSPIPDYIQEGFTKEDVKNMGGSLKIHARIGLDIDIRVIAKIRGDIAIGIL